MVPGDPGPARLAALLERRGDGRPLESTLEGKVWLLLQRSGVRLPARQHWVHTTGGRYRLDFAWPDRKLGLEADSWEHHGDRVAFGKDRERLSEMVALGWRVLLVTWDIGDAAARDASSDGSRWRSPPDSLSLHVRNSAVERQ